MRIRTKNSISLKPLHYLLSLFFSVVASVPPTLQVLPDLPDELFQMLQLQDVQLLHFEFKLKMLKVWTIRLYLDHHVLITSKMEKYN